MGRKIQEPTICRKHKWYAAAPIHEQTVQTANSHFQDPQTKTVSRAIAHWRISSCPIQDILKNLAHMYPGKITGVDQ